MTAGTAEIQPGFSKKGAGLRTRLWGISSSGPERDLPLNRCREGVASSQGRLPYVPVFDPWHGYDRAVIEDPLKSALEEITPKLDPGLEPLAAALLAEEPVEDAWATLLQEILDAA